MSTPTVTQIKHAIAIAEKIEKLQAELSGLTASEASAASTATLPKRRGGKRHMSAATIAKMRAAQQARWAKIKGTAPAAAPAIAPKKGGKRKGKLSAEGRARIVAALKARWAAKKKK